MADLYDRAGVRIRVWDPTTLHERTAWERSVSIRETLLASSCALTAVLALLVSTGYLMGPGNNVIRSTAGAAHTVRLIGWIGFGVWAILTAFVARRFPLLGEFPGTVVVERGSSVDPDLRLLERAAKAATRGAQAAGQLSGWHDDRVSRAAMMPVAVYRLAEAVAGSIPGTLVAEIEPMVESMERLVSEVEALCVDRQPLLDARAILEAEKEVSDG